MFILKKILEPLKLEKSKWKKSNESHYLAWSKFVFKLFWHLDIIFTQICNINNDTSIGLPKLWILVVNSVRSRMGAVPLLLKNRREEGKKLEQNNLRWAMCTSPGTHYSWCCPSRERHTSNYFGQFFMFFPADFWAKETPLSLQCKWGLSVSTGAWMTENKGHRWQKTVIQLWNKTNTKKIPHNQKKLIHCALLKTERPKHWD